MENTRNTNATIGTAASVVSLELTNAQRSVIILTNISTNGQVIYLACDSEAEASKGIPISVGGFHSESIDAGFVPSNKQWTAISSAAGATLSIHERIISRSNL